MKNFKINQLVRDNLFKKLVFIVKYKGTGVLVASSDNNFRTWMTYGECLTLPTRFEISWHAKCN